MASRNLTTFIARASDALMVVATMDNNFESEGSFSHLTTTGPKRTLLSDRVFHWMIF